MHPLLPKKEAIKQRNVIRHLYQSDRPLARLAKTLFYYSAEALEAILSSRYILFNVAFIARARFAMNSFDHNFGTTTER